MFTSVDKAIVAFVMAVVMFAQNAGIVLPDFLTHDWIVGLVALITPALVYFWPNKATA